MAKGSYNISVSGDSNLEEEGRNNNENQECMNSCLSSTFLRSLSLHDRPRSSRVPINKELRKSRYKALSSSLEKIPSNPSPPSEARSECSTNRGFESVGINAVTEATTHPSIYDASSSATHQQTGQNQLSEPDSWLEDGYTRFSVESEKLLEKAVAILRTVDEDISESLTNLTKPESIASESVLEIYRNKGKSTIGCSAGSKLDLSTESSNQPTYENWQPSVQQRPKDIQAHSTPRRPKNLQAQSPRQSPKNMQAQSSRQSPKNMQAQSSRQSPKNMQAQSSRQSPKNMQAPSSRQIPKIVQIQSSQQSPKNAKTQTTQQSPKNLPTRSAQQSPKNFQAHSAQQSLKNLPIHSVQQNPKILQAQSPPQSPQNVLTQSSRQNPKNLQIQSSQQSPKNLLVKNPQETLKNFESLLRAGISKPDSDDVRSVEESPRNLLSSPKISAPDGTTKVKSLIEFDLPSDHEQFIKIIGALQNRCLEYREMIQDIAVSALEVCLNFSELSVSRIWHLRRQFESQKRNFEDFKELCCTSVVFGPDSLPINEKVTEVIQSFYLKLLQEENDTFMTRLEFGLKMGEVYAKLLKLETESKKIITTLEKEILYLKKTSVGFKV